MPTLGHRTRQRAAIEANWLAEVKQVHVKDPHTVSCWSGTTGAAISTSTSAPLVAVGKATPGAVASAPDAVAVGCCSDMVKIACSVPSVHKSKKPL